MPLLITAFFVGACFGSFANVLIYRIPRGMQFIWGNSLCPECGRKIKPYDLFPLLSYAVLRGRCRYCKTKISFRYPLVEFIAGVLAVIVLLIYGYGLQGLLCFLIFVVLLVISFIDAEYMIIPNGLVLTLAVLSLGFILYGGGLRIGWFSRAAGFFALSLPMFALTLVVNDAFGGGDIKLIAVCGFLLGAKLVCLAGFISVALGGCYAVYLICKGMRSARIAFGQYICIGVFISMVAGDNILRIYWNAVMQ